MRQSRTVLHRKALPQSMVAPRPSCHPARYLSRMTGNIEPYCGSGRLAKLSGSPDGEPGNARLAPGGNRERRDPLPVFAVHRPECKGR